MKFPSSTSRTKLPEFINSKKEVPKVNDDSLMVGAPVCPRQAYIAKESLGQLKQHVPRGNFSQYEVLPSQ
jgi:hypothetical protein